MPYALRVGRWLMEAGWRWRRLTSELDELSNGDDADHQPKSEELPINGRLDKLGAHDDDERDAERHRRHVPPPLRVEQTRLEALQHHLPVLLDLFLGGDGEAVVKGQIVEL